MSTALVWFRRDLRVHDHPPLRAALDACERVVPVFVLDERLLGVSENREAFLYACLRDLRESLQQRGGNLVVVRGRPEQELPKLAKEHDATAVYFASDVSPFAMDRDRRVVEALSEAGHRAPPHPRELHRRHRQAQALRRLHAVLEGLAAAAAARGPRRSAQGARAART